jgi:hypothetical protein
MAATLLHLSASPMTRSELTETEIMLARAACTNLSGAWSAATELDYAGRIALILIPAGDDDQAPSFHLAIEDGAIALGACRWDRFTALGRFPSVTDAMDAVARAI